ncbi:hypothetical protein BG003_010559 [Podila horticola]|nr:hypothetical protein BG003_010559 [Podila horticola]
MRSSWSILASLALFLVLSLSSSSFTSAQSPNCHACIKRVVPTVANCTTLTPAQLNTVDLAIHGHKFGEESSTFKTTEPAAFQCLAALMWDSVHYKATLWGKCLDPAASCPWSEMVQYMTIIPRMAAIYGVPNPPAQVLVDPPQ